MTELETLRQLVAAREKATKGDWRLHPNGLGGATTEIWIDDAETPEKGTRITKHIHGPYNAAFIAASANCDLRTILERMEKMEAGLRYYADPENQKVDLVDLVPVHRLSNDKGQRAREALEG